MFILLFSLLLLPLLTDEVNDAASMSKVNSPEDVWKRDPQLAARSLTICVKVM